MIVTAADFLQPTSNKSKGPVKLMIDRLIDVGKAISGKPLRDNLAGLRIGFRWTEPPGGGTGAFYDTTTNTISVDCGPEPAPGRPLDTYDQIPTQLLPGIWDQILFEFRNFYNALQLDKCKAIGRYAGALIEHGNAKSDVETITWTLYVGDLKAVLTKVAAPVDRLAVVQAMSILGQRAIDRYLTFARSDQNRPDELMNAFRITPHGGTGAVAGSREALFTPLLYTVERLERWFSTPDFESDRVIAERIARAMVVATHPRPKPDTIMVQVAHFRVANPPAGADSVARFDTLIQALRTNWCQTQPQFDHFAQSIGVDPTTFGSVRQTVDAALADARPDAATLDGGATISQALLPAAQPVVNAAFAADFSSVDVPHEAQLTHELRHRNGDTFLERGRS